MIVMLILYIFVAATAIYAAIKCKTTIRVIFTLLLILPYALAFPAAFVPHIHTIRKVQADVSNTICQPMKRLTSHVNLLLETGRYDSVAAIFKEIEQDHMLLRYQYKHKPYFKEFVDRLIVSETSDSTEGKHIQ